LEDVSNKLKSSQHSSHKVSIVKSKYDNNNFKESTITFSRISNAFLLTSSKLGISLGNG